MQQLAYLLRGQLGRSADTTRNAAGALARLCMPSPPAGAKLPSPLPHPPLCLPCAGGSAYPHEEGKNGKALESFGLTADMVDRKIAEALEKYKKDNGTAAV